MIERRREDVQAQAIAWRLRLGDGPLTSEDRAAYEAWRAADAEHAAAFDIIEDIWTAVGERANRPGVVLMRGAALTDLRSVSRRTRLRSWLGQPRLAAMAAGLAAALALGSLVLWSVNAPRTISTGLGERQAVMLADGSRVSLDAESAVTVRLAHDRRALTLEQGRARFTVAHDPLRPFTVRAGDRTIVAIGTDFSVERIDGAVRVILYEGRVAALTTPRANSREQTEPVRVGKDRRSIDRALNPGEELVLAGDHAAITPAALDPGRSLAWEAGQLAFSNETLGRAVARMNRYADRPLKVADAETAAVRISGAFTAGDTEAFVEGVTGVFPILARREGENIVLIKNSRPDG